MFALLTYIYSVIVAPTSNMFTSTVEHSLRYRCCQAAARNTGNGESLDHSSQLQQKWTLEHKSICNRSQVV